MRFVFLGGKAIGDYVLNGLIDNNHIPNGIVLYKDIISHELLKKAKTLGIDILKIHSFRNQQDDIIDFVDKLKVDHYISVAFPFILPATILSLVNYPINIHTGAIPKYRGHHPLSAAFLNDEPYQASTIHLMATEVDAGDILLQDFVKVDNEDTIVTVREKLMILSLKLILTVIKQLGDGTVYPKKQIGEVIYAPKRSPEDSKIDLSNSSRYLHNFVRALVDPYPNAFAYNKENKIVKFKKSFSNNIPGLVLAELGDRQYIISSGDGVILVETDVELRIGDKLT